VTDQQLDDRRPYCPLHPGERLRRLDLTLGQPAVYVHADNTWHTDRLGAGYGPQHQASVYEVAGWTAGVDDETERWGATCGGPCGGVYRAPDLGAVCRMLDITPCALPAQLPPDISAAE
jgi:hypothetical protein